MSQRSSILINVYHPHFYPYQYSPSSWSIGVHYANLNRKSRKLLLTKGLAKYVSQLILGRNVRFESTQTQEGVNCVGKFYAISGNRLRPCSDRVFVTRLEPKLQRK